MDIRDEWFHILMFLPVKNSVDLKHVMSIEYVSSIVRQTMSVMWKTWLKRDCSELWRWLKGRYMIEESQVNWKQCVIHNALYIRTQQSEFTAKPVYDPPSMTGWIKKYKISVVGGSGSGKTTFIHSFGFSGFKPVCILFYSE
jgi:hypothetical protein